MASDKCAKAKTNSNKPCQKRYVSTMRSKLNALERALRAGRRETKRLARRAAGKRNAYLIGRKNRDHGGRRVPV